ILQFRNFICHILYNITYRYERDGGLGLVYVFYIVAVYIFIFIVSYPFILVSLWNKKKHTEQTGALHRVLFYVINKKTRYKKGAESMPLIQDVFYTRKFLLVNIYEKVFLLLI
ncbi:hypothetical protein ACJX0J_009650, partial [Zea mays]